MMREHFWTQLRTVIFRNRAFRGLTELSVYINILGTYSRLSRSFHTIHLLEILDYVASSCSPLMEYSNLYLLDLGHQDYIQGEGGGLGFTKKN